MRVSVLVAVYNAEKYLSVCLDSLMNQTHEDIQIICIDDASTDSSWKILQEYAAKDSRITLLKQPENRGQAEARNRGLQIADGDVVTMLDSDDWFSLDALEKGCRMMQEDASLDCVLYDVCYVDESSGRKWRYEYRVSELQWSGEEAFRLSLDWSIHGLYMVRREIHQTYPYDTTCRLYSDDNTTRLHYMHSRKVARCEGVYYYRQHEASMTHAVTPLRFLYLDANFSMKQTMVSEGVSDALLNQYEAHRWLNLVGLYVFYWSTKKAFNAQERKFIRQKLKLFLSTIEVWRLPQSSISKFGYLPLQTFPFLFELQTFLYTYIRKGFCLLKGEKLPEN